MGRRKIEIQPILHDRNRSVTFLKRKNGLFKKAFELGVLCSVDVVVTVFGHNQKLYEYSSAQNGSSARILERRKNYTGEKECKGPQDFGGDKGDGEDDSDDALAQPSSSKNGPRDPPPSMKLSGLKASKARSRSPHDNDQSEGQSSFESPLSSHLTSPAQGRGKCDIAYSHDFTAGPPGPGVHALYSPNSSESSQKAFPSGQSLFPNQQPQNFNSSSHGALGSAQLQHTLVQLLATNPYLASQLAQLPSIMNMGLGGFGGAFPSAGAAGGTMSGLPAFSVPGLHPLYSNPLFANFFAQQQHLQQQQQQGSSQSSSGAGAPSQQQGLPNLSIPGLAADANANPNLMAALGLPSGVGQSHQHPQQHPPPHQAPSHSNAPSPAVWRKHDAGELDQGDDEPLRFPDFGPTLSGASSTLNNPSIHQGTTWLEFLNAISNTTAVPSTGAPGTNPTSDKPNSSSTPSFLRPSNAGAPSGMGPSSLSSLPGLNGLGLGNIGNFNFNNLSIPHPSASSSDLAGSDAGRPHKRTRTDSGQSDERPGSGLAQQHFYRPQLPMSGLHVHGLPHHLTNGRGEGRDSSVLASPPPEMDLENDIGRGGTSADRCEVSE